MKKTYAWLVLLSTATVGCSHNNRLPPRLDAGAPIRYAELEVPSSLEVLSMDFEAVAFQGDGSTHGRTFLKIYGRHRTTGVRYLLIYERGTERRRPVEVIELASIEDSTIVGRQ